MTLEETLKFRSTLTSKYARGEISEVPPIFPDNVWRPEVYTLSGSIELICHVCGGIIRNRTKMVKNPTCHNCKATARAMSSRRVRDEMREDRARRLKALEAHLDSRGYYSTSKP